MTQINTSMKQKQTTNIENRFEVAKEEGWQGREGLGTWDQQLQTRCISCINNNVLQYSTGNYIQYSVTNHNGKEYEKEYICITESLCCSEEINTTL